MDKHVDDMYIEFINVIESIPDGVIPDKKEVIKQFAGTLKDYKSELDLMEERITEDRKNDINQFHYNIALFLYTDNQNLPLLILNIYNFFYLKLFPVTSSLQQ